MATIRTYSGAVIDLENPSFTEVIVVDIAEALSKQCRFTGHTKKFYSVAEHCCHAYHLAPAGHKLEALMHDASEAFLGDVSAPLKSLLPCYQALEHNMSLAIRKYLDLPPKISPVVHEVDRRLCSTEQVWLMGKDPAECLHPPFDMGDGPPCWEPEVAAQMFVGNYLEGFLFNL